MQAGAKVSQCHSQSNSATPLSTDRPNIDTSVGKSVLSALQSIYKAIDPRHDENNNAEPMTTPAMTAILKSQVQFKGGRAKESPEAQFAQFEKDYLSKPFVLVINTASEHYHAGVDLPTINSTYGALHRKMGACELKGSAVTDITHAKDIDIFKQSPNLRVKNTTKLVAGFLRKQLGTKAQKFSDEQLVSLYTYTAKRAPEKTIDTASAGARPEPDFLKKYRFNVDKKKCTPVDLVFYTELPAEFDQLLGSDTLRINVKKQCIEAVKILNQDTRAWMIKHNYIWWNERMMDPVPRIKKHFAKTPELRSLNANAVANLYDQMTADQRAEFFCWAIRNRCSDGFSETQAEVVGITAEKLMALKTSGTTKGIHADTSLKDVAIFQENLAYFVRAAQKKYTNTSHNGNAEGLIQCMKIVGHKPLKSVLQKHPHTLPSAAQISALFPSPTLTDLRTEWLQLKANKAKSANAQIRSLLSHATLSTLNKVLFAEEHKNQPMSAQQREFVSDLLLLMAEHTGNKTQQIGLRLFKLNTAQNATEETEAIHKLFDLAREANEGQNLLKAPYATIINALSTKKLSGRALKSFKKLYSPLIARTLTEIAEHANLSSQAKSILLTWKAQAALNDFTTTVSLDESLADQTRAYAYAQTQHQAYFKKADTLRQTIAALIRTHKSPMISHYIFPVEGPDGIPGHALRTDDKNCLMTEKYLHAGKIKLPATPDTTKRSKAVIKGAGVRVLTSGELHIGQFQKDHLEDSNAHIITTNAWYNGAISGSGLHNGDLWLNDLKGKTAELKPFLDVLLPLPDDRHNRTFRVSADFTGQDLDSLHAPSIDAAPEATITVATADNNSVRIIRHNKEYDSIRLANYQNQPHHTLAIDFRRQLDGSLILHPEKARLYDSEQGKKVTGTFNPKSKNIEGPGLIHAHDFKTQPEIKGELEFKSEPEADLLYSGELINFEPHGFGTRYSESEPAGVHGQFNRGELHDVRLLSSSSIERTNPSDFFVITPKQNNNNGVTKITFTKKPIPTETYPFTLPPYNATGNFSLMDDRGNQIYGEWHSGRITGHLEQSTLTFTKKQSGEFLAIPQAQYDQAIAQGVAFGDQFLTMQDGQGKVHYFMPIGDHTIETTQQDDETSSLKKILLSDGTTLIIKKTSQSDDATPTIKKLSFALGKRLEKPFGSADFITAAAAYSEENNNLHAVMRTSLTDAFYIGEVTSKKVGRATIYVTQGNGASFLDANIDIGPHELKGLTGDGTRISADGSVFKGTFESHAPKKGELTQVDGSVFKGTFEDHAPKKGELTQVDGSVFKGIFNHNGPKFGTLTLPEGAQITGSFSKTGINNALEPQGEVSMTIPIGAQSRAFEFKVKNGLIVGGVTEKVKAQNPRGATRGTTQRVSFTTKASKAAQRWRTFATEIQKG